MTLHAPRGEARPDLLHGTLDMLILRTLLFGPQHGYAIAQVIRAQSSDVLQVEAGSLYPALQRLTKKGWVTGTWGQTEANQRAKFYRLTPEGRRQLTREASRWSELVDAIGRVMTRCWTLGTTNEARSDRCPSGPG
jgi:PadR family transcriptional regulator PadR